jgi:signal transduction histidine kinase
VKREQHLKRKYRKRVEEYQIEKDREVYKSKVNFFINLIHEIRTPLTLIKLPLESIMHVNIDRKMEERYLNVINKNVDYLLGITNELLDFQKIESGEIKLHLQQHDICHFINSLSDLPI